MSYILALYGIGSLVLIAYLLCFLALALKHRQAALSSLPDDSRLTVIIPVANEEAMMAHCLESILNQDLSRVDAILVALNGSLDKTSSIVADYAKRHSFISTLSLPRLGKTAAILAAIERAATRYILVLDVDTCLLPGAIARLLKFHLNSQKAVTTCLIDPLTRNALIPKLISCDRIFRSRILNIARDAWGMANVPGNLFITDKEIYRSLMLRETLLEDNEFTYQLWRHGQKVACMPEVLACEKERLTLINLIHQRKRWVLGNIDTFGSFLKALPVLTLPQRLAALSYPLLWYILHYALALGSFMAFADPGWRAAYLSLAASYWICLCAAFSILPTAQTRTFSWLDAVVHVLTFPLAVTASTFLALTHLLRDQEALRAEQNKITFVRDSFHHAI